ncbi:hypothetical protein C9439_03860 [archaeon SCG-AAA382B04]|nr:hypothetical protein C9439_03860 [archaeon SCG-AAA382B04]
MTYLILGIDAATWDVVKPNLEELPYFNKLIDICEIKNLEISEAPLSPLIWTGMFSGTYYEEHNHKEFVEDNEIVSRDDLDFSFIWDELDEKMDVRALNVPFIVPTYSYNVDYEPVGFGLPTDEEEWKEELEKISDKTKEILKEEPDLVISVFTLLDRVQHFHWGEDKVLEWYKKLDKKLGELLFDSGFLEKKENKLIIVSDHGFCGFDEAEVQTLPKEGSERELKGDHSREAILLTKNINGEIENPQDIYKVIKKEIN